MATAKKKASKKSKAKKARKARLRAPARRRRRSGAKKRATKSKRVVKKAKKASRRLRRKSPRRQPRRPRRKRLPRRPPRNLRRKPIEESRCSAEKTSAVERDSSAAKRARPHAAREAAPAPQAAGGRGRNTYFITTAIAYPNGMPHIGHAYEAIATDALARFQRLDGKDVFFLTGTDEHGLKMIQTAQSERHDAARTRRPATPAASRRWTSA